MLGPLKNLVNQGSSPPSSNIYNSDNLKKKLTNSLPLFLALVFIAEIGLLARVDLIKNPDLVNYWDESFVYRHGGCFAFCWGGGRCEEWLEREDSVVYSRYFCKEPILISGREELCSVGCKFSLRKKKKKADASFGLHKEEGTAVVLLSMESAHYLTRNEISKALGCHGNHNGNVEKVETLKINK
uniref:Uncharacterized protein n=1 Tax=Lactuca sativa TaxID=4236 RepID=A0A9R1VPB6_LACSA|nr:hypothetical protein LSAT_V11C400200310 [Lactuca sativa]